MSNEYLHLKENWTVVTNEELDTGLQRGNVSCGERLVAQNENFLAGQARKFVRQYHMEDAFEDLMQEGALALLDAAQRFDGASGLKLLSYAGSAVQSVMLDYTATNAACVSVPTSRFV
ncbi:sigma factor [Oscillibacter valericigenes]|nr:sigma factor [Oscillibacter valericigenes]